MIIRNSAVLLFLIFSSLCASAQSQKKALSVDDLTGWQRVTKSEMSHDGRFVAIRHEPWKGDATVLLYNNKGDELGRFHPAGDFRFASSSRLLVVQEKPSVALTDELKLKKTKKEKMPMDKLILFSVDGKKETIDSVRLFKVSEATDWMAYQRGDRKDSTLFVRSLDGRSVDSIPAVSDFGFAEKGGGLYYVSAGDSLGLVSGMYVYQTDSKKRMLVKPGSGSFRKADFDKEGGRLTFLYADEAEKDSADRKNGYALYLALLPDTARLIAEKGHAALAGGLIVSGSEAPRFSRNGEFLFFSVMPEPRQKDSTVLAENRPEVQIWNWNEAVQYTQQHVDRKKREGMTFTAACHLPTQGITQLNTAELPNLQLPDSGYLALVSTNEPYGTERMWTGRNRHDLYLVDMLTGERSLLLRGSDARARISPTGKYACWYSEPDSSWFTCLLSTKQIYRLTTPGTFEAWDKDNDVPDFPPAYGSAGWSKNDEAILIYDRNDIWRFSPVASADPVNLTVNGKKIGVRYQLKPLDKEVNYVDLSQTQLLTGFDETSKATGFYSARLDKPAQPIALLTGDFKASILGKAKNADGVIYTTESFASFPEVRCADLRFKKPVQLTRLGGQQDSIRWGTASLTAWTSLEGKLLEGVVYKPADFDPNRKYPLIVNFYERNSETLHNYRMPEPHRSTIDYHLYNSQGYIVFNPDVRYEKGFPGENCYNSVMPGIESLINQGFIDEKAIAAQGHSWGGYQVAYLATRTDLFAAIESGAPVVNMFSAYGGIRWGTGLNRSFQYEHGQSRIGETPWENPLRYQENSPLFTMDRVNTPILIMHNDADGHVPWHLGIEYFVALKRLQKPVWLLNYPGEPHWPMKMANRVDFQKRMFAFFEHYLKGKQQPKWMSEGVKAVDQPFELGY